MCAINVIQLWVFSEKLASTKKNQRYSILSYFWAIDNYKKKSSLLNPEFLLSYWKVQKINVIQQWGFFKLLVSTKKKLKLLHTYFCKNLYTCYIHVRFIIKINSRIKQIIQTKENATLRRICVPLYAYQHLIAY